jgi:hypothetical protein
MFGVGLVLESVWGGHKLGIVTEMCGEFGVCLGLFDLGVRLECVWGMFWSCCGVCLGYVSFGVCLGYGTIPSGYKRSESPCEKYSYK